MTGALVSRIRALMPVPFGQRPPLRAPDFPFLLLWSHKAASTALAQWFFAQIGSPHLRDGSAEAHRQYAGLGIHAYQFGVHCRGSLYRYRCRRALFDGSPLIKFVRDPAARAFSAFLATRRGVVLERPEFWGARVSRQVLAWKGVQDPAGAYSFAEFVDWMAATPVARQNPHVRAQWLGFEAGLKIEFVPIENLVARLAALEQRFGLSAVSARTELLSSGHHRLPSPRIDPSDLQQQLSAPVLPGDFDARPSPFVDTSVLTGTLIGARLSEALAMDYRACPLY